MVSKVLSCLVCVSCVVVIPAAFAEDCSSYYDSYGDFHGTQLCGDFCCGSCNLKYCCSYRSYRLTEADQKKCPKRSTYGNNDYKPDHGNDPQSSTAVIAGSVIGTIIQISICVGLIICCVAPCCLCCKRCRNRHNRGHRNVEGAITVVYSPQQPPPEYQQSHPGYQSVPVYESMPRAPPPSYLESIGPGHPPAAFDQGQPMYPLQPPSQHYALPPHSGELVSPPYNTSYIPNP